MDSLQSASSLPPPELTHTERYRKMFGVKREKLIEWLVDNFLEQRGVLVSNGLSTDIVIFPEDKLPHRKDRLNRKIDEGMEYSTAYIDVDELNCLYQLQPRPDNTKSIRLPLALYLYFADECSHLTPHTSFLTELRNAGAKLKYPESCDEAGRRALLDKVLTALDNLGMDEEHKIIMRDWFEKGSFTIGNEWHGFDEKSEPKGSYLHLANIIVDQKRYVGMNLPISYALGNEQSVLELCPPHPDGSAKTQEEKKADTEKVLAMTRALVAESKESGSYSEITERIRRGYAIRKNVMHKAIDAIVMPPPPSPESRAETEKTARGIAGYLSDETLDILRTKQYTIAYANEPFIEKCLPTENFPGLSLTFDDLKTDKGYRQGRYSTIFTCNGWRAWPKDIKENEDMRYKVVAQSLMHETMHIAIDNVYREDADRLKDAVWAVHRELFRMNENKELLPPYFRDFLETLQTCSLVQAIDLGNSLYTNYNKNGVDTRWVEVACNVYGLMHTDFLPDARYNNPYRDFPALGALSEVVTDIMKKGRQRCLESQVEQESKYSASAAAISLC